MTRVVPALVIGAAAAAGIVYIMTLLLGDDPVKPSANNNVWIEGPISIGDESGPVDSYPQPDCDSQIEGFKKLIADSQACVVDSDCKIAVFMCPFGLVAIDSSAIPRLERQHRELKQCQTCVYHWGHTEHEYRAVCIENQCRIKDYAPDELEELMQRTLEVIAD